MIKTFYFMPPGTLKGYTTLGQNGTEWDSNEGVIHTDRSSRTGA